MNSSWCLQTRLQAMSQTRWKLGLDGSKFLRKISRNTPKVVDLLARHSSTSSYSQTSDFLWTPPQRSRPHIQAYSLKRTLQLYL